ncbi:MAG: endonuclease/exonuclease/phosphatase family protein [Deltaproteobacteria bacterium]|nr:endonuclease/exonuclease/phosphatase family protein [Deltaproteobacteria bacterium]
MSTSSRGLLRVVAVGATVVALAPIGTIAGCAAVPPPPEGAGRLTVMSFNLNYGLSGDEDTLAAIDVCACDIVALQEVTPAWRRAIEARYGARYPHMHFITSEGPGGLAVLSRTRITRADTLAEVTWFPAQRVIVDGPLGAVQVLNVHLRPPFDDDGSMVIGIFVTPEMRKREIAAFRAQLLSIPTIVVGDFNESSGQALDHLGAHGFSDALALANGQRTWRWPTPVLELSDRLDHVMYARAAFVPVEVRVVERGRSDHFPVVATFGRRPAAGPKYDDHTGHRPPALSAPPPDC